MLGILSGLALLFNSASATARVREIYSSNALCKKRYCINPIFPALEDLHTLNSSNWTCSDLKATNDSLGFCRNVINYHSSLRNTGTGTTTIQAIKMQEQLAVTMYAYHLSGMGLEFWDYQDPEHSQDPCVKSVWRLACYTYFPRAPKDCAQGDDVSYLRPCQSSCGNYVRTCGVECCDESVKCVFEHNKQLSATVNVMTRGYFPEEGPSERCTGGAFGQTTFWILLALLFVHCPRRMVLISALAGSVLIMHGWDAVPTHSVGNWRGKPDYLSRIDYIPPGAKAEDSVLNSCSIDKLASTLQCSGRGTCKSWDDSDVQNPVMFCVCDKDWADPECRTRRKSQATAYVISLVAGFLGADMFYLGFPDVGALKLCTLGGCDFDS
eukprot:GEMP01018955.1.p1 GENE.GEMP01018955.1~~GEMP01018955.1.p1  ORF type:complete len:381 (+),score=32.41 GEMP01018955.1:284-1426(+)